MSKHEVSLLLEEHDIARDISSDTVNRHRGQISPVGRRMIYVSQCKPSTSSKGHWNYDFFHTLSFDLVTEIGDDSGIVVLLDYVNRKFAVLTAGDLIWVAKFSSRNKSNEGMVCDFVIDRGRDGEYCLRPYDRMRPERRRVEIYS